MELTLALGVQQPDAGLLEAHAGDQRLAVRGQRGALLLGRARCHLLGLTIGVPLPPDVKGAASIRREKHRSAVGRPCGGRALSVEWSHGVAGRRAIEGHQPARHPAATVHFSQQQRLAVGRTRRAMDHAAFASWKIDVSQVASTLGRRHDSHVNAGHDCGVHQPLVVEPDESRCVRQQRLRGAAKHGHLPRIPSESRHDRGVDDSRAIR